MKRCIILSLAWFGVLGLAGCGKMAEPIALPSVEEITSVETSVGTGDSNKNYSITDREWIETFLSIVSEAEATNKATIQDTPDVEEYYKTDIVCGESITTL